MKKTLFLLLVGVLVFSMAQIDTFAAKKAGKGGAIPAQKMTEMSETIDRLTKKVYSNSLFSPEDNSEMIEIKITLDNQMLIAPDLTLAPLYYRAANLYNSRGYKKESIECYQTILENFPDTALAPKATQALKAMGVNIITPKKEEGATTGQAASIIQSESDEINSLETKTAPAELIEI